MPKYGSQIDTNRIPIKGVLYEPVTAFPANPVEGLHVHRTDLRQTYAYLNGAWVRTDNQGFSTIGHNHPIYEVTGLIDELDARVLISRNVATGEGLTGGGTLAQDMTLAIDFAANGTGVARQAVRATDSRLSDSRTPTGTAGGDLAGTFPSPTIKQGAITDFNVNANLKDPVPAATGLRSLGSGAQQAMPGNTRLDQITAPSAPVSMGFQRVTNVASPTAAQDAVNKQYVDSIASGFSQKGSVRVVATANITLSGLQAIDGVTLVAGDRVLVTAQTSAATNGIYVAGSGAWTRPSDFDETAEVNAGAFVFVSEGTQYDNSGWSLITNNPITLGTTAQTWTQTSGAGQITAGSGLTKSGNTLAVAIDTASMQVVNNLVGIKPLGVTAAMLAGGIDIVGKTTGTLSIARGGTGGTTALQARQALSAVGIWTGNLAVAAAGTWSDYAHNLGTVNPQVVITEAATGDQFVMDVRVKDANTVSVKADMPIALSAFRISVQGA